MLMVVVKAVVKIHNRVAITTLGETARVLGEKTDGRVLTGGSVVCPIPTRSGEAEAVVTADDHHLHTVDIPIMVDSSKSTAVHNNPLDHSE
jgi:hypothetical protein